MRQENDNYECVAILKEEIRKLKQSNNSSSQRTNIHEQNQKTPSKREIAALSTEYDLL